VHASEHPTIAPAPERAETAAQRWRDALPQFMAEARGGCVSAAVAAPLAIGFGMFAFVGLGDEFFGHGVLAGLYAALIAGLVCVILGDRSGTIYAPRVVTTFFIGTLLLQHVAYSDAAIVANGGSAVVLAIVFTIVFLAGVMQLMFGVLRIGTLIRFTPQPVIAGFQNCAALLLVIAQFSQVLGFDTHVPLGKLASHIGETKLLSVAVATIAALATWNAKRWVARMPPVLFGLLAGTVAYYALVGLAGKALLGPVLGSAPSVALIPVNASVFVELIRHPQFGEILPLLLSGAFSIAVIASVDALVCSRLLEGPGAPRTPANVQLTRLGAANMVAACFGGITAGFNLGPTLVNRAFGGRGRVSVLVNAFLTLLLIVAAMPLVAYLPRAALSGVIVVIGIQHIDRWSIALGRQVFGGKRQESKSATLDFLIVLLVALVSIVVDIVSAVLLGVAVSIVFFLARMSRSVVRRAYRANAARSRKSRDPLLMQFLAERGAVILVAELDGALFFGTAEQLSERLEQELEHETRYVILDFKRVTEVDSTGAGCVQQLCAQLAERHAKLIVCGVLPSSAFYRVLQDGGVVGEHGKAWTFVDVDRAIEGAEDELIAAECDTAEKPGDYPLGALSLLRRMDLQEMVQIKARLTRRHYAPLQVVFDQGDPGEALFIVLSGSASARMIDQGRERRLMTFGPGGIFGEMGLLEGSTRSATVVADDELECLVLDKGALEQLTREHPSIAIKLLAGLGKELATRLRLVNRTILHLEA
jgi:sulfate permease, SulP family